ncbi:hypothetical protein [Myxacorys almedinensis]|uniref:hypothetical protein n=1 Tax=Myxacorys almedinensis TaxID=2651157 RepID=UPI001EE45637|nr:hypothetical protein [Myxacorys almedinensis]
MKLLSKAGAEFWLPLPLVGLLFWLAGHAIAHQVLHRSYTSTNRLQADTQLEVKAGVTIIVISAAVDRQRGRTTVVVETTDSSLKKVEYTYWVTDVKEVEAAIARELGTSVENVRKLVRYRLID